MPDTIPTEEQIREIKQILRRLHQRRIIAAYAYASLVLAMIPILHFRIGSGTVYLSICVVNGFGAYKAFRWATKRFARNLTPSERELLALAPVVPLTARENTEFEELREQYQQMPIHQQYLRASQPNDSGDTLLRAATSTDNTPQDQLLRPTQYNDSTP